MKTKNYLQIFTAIAVISAGLFTFTSFKSNDNEYVNKVLTEINSDLNSYENDFNTIVYDTVPAKKVKDTVKEVKDTISNKKDAPKGKKKKCGNGKCGGA